MFSFQMAEIQIWSKYIGVLQILILSISLYIYYIDYRIRVPSAGTAARSSSSSLSENNKQMKRCLAQEQRHLD